MKVPTLDVAGLELGSSTKIASFGLSTPAGSLTTLTVPRWNPRGLFYVPGVRLQGRREDTGGCGRRLWSRRYRKRRSQGLGNPGGLVGQQKLSSCRIWEKKLKEWKQGRGHRQASRLRRSIPDSLFIKIRGGKSALEIWEALSAIFQNKSRNGCCKLASEAPVGALR